MSLGVLVTYVFGLFLPWDELAYLGCAFAALLFLGLSTMPRSPVWLIAKGRKDDAREALIRLRGFGIKVE